MTSTAKMRETGTPWWLVLSEGIAALVVGILLLLAPKMTTLILVQTLGLFWLSVGILRIINIFIDRSMWGWKLVSGIIGILAGLLVLQHPLWSTLLLPATLVILLGIGGIVMGAVSLVQAFRGAGWGTGILGVLSIIFGILLLGSSSLIAGVALVYTLGILGVVGGVIGIIMAIRMR